MINFISQCLQFNITRTYFIVVLSSFFCLPKIIISLPVEPGYSVVTTILILLTLKFVGFFKSMKEFYNGIADLENSKDIENFMLNFQESKTYIRVSRFMPFAFGFGSASLFSLFL